MKTGYAKLVSIAVLSLAGFAVKAQAPSIAASWGLYVYPRGGQPLEKLQTDEGECVAWARNTTGVDPNNPGAGVTVAPPPQSSGVGVSAGSGAVRGAARAGLIGNIADKDASEWAAYGAVIGAARGAQQRQNQNTQSQAAAQANAEAETQKRMDQFLNAFSVCMDGRNYSVSKGL
jgi:hypothetical protein